MKTIDASIGTIINTYKLLSIASEKLGSRKTEIIYTCKCIVCKKIRKLRKSRKKFQICSSVNLLILLGRICDEGGF